MSALSGSSALLTFVPEAGIELMTPGFSLMVVVVVGVSDQSSSLGSQLTGHQITIYGVTCHSTTLRSPGLFSRYYAVVIGFDRDLTFVCFRVITPPLDSTLLYIIYYNRLVVYSLWIGLLDNTFQDTL
jgi:hypothetical protein